MEFDPSASMSSVNAPVNMMPQFVVGFGSSMLLWCLVAFGLPSVFAATPWAAIMPIIAGVMLGIYLPGTGHMTISNKPMLKLLPWVIFFAAGSALLFQIFKVSCGGVFGSVFIIPTLVFAGCSTLCGTIGFSVQQHQKWWRSLCFESTLGAGQEREMAQQMWNLKKMQSMNHTSLRTPNSHGGGMQHHHGHSHGHTQGGLGQGPTLGYAGGGNGGPSIV